MPPQAAPLHVCCDEQPIITFVFGSSSLAMMDKPRSAQARQMTLRVGVLAEEATNHAADSATDTRRASSRPTAHAQMTRHVAMISEPHFAAKE